MVHKKEKILIAGYEIGGQMQLLAEAFRRRGISATSLAFNESFMNHKNDVKIPVGHWFKRLIFLIKSIKQYQVYHFFWGVSLFSFWRFHHLDLPVLRLFGKKIFCHFRGSDVMSSEYSDYLVSKFDDSIKSEMEPNFSNALQMKGINKWKKYSDKIFVSTPNLSAIDKNSILVPQVIDINYWQTDKPPLSEKDGIIRVVHAPSNRDKKGTVYIENAISSLQKKGYPIELLLLENLEASMIKEYYEKADIGIDQLIYGWHGKVACELMAMKKPVISYINPKFCGANFDLPIVSASPLNIEIKLEELIRSKELRMKVGIASLKYVKKHHDVEVQIDNLLKLYSIEDVE